MMNLKEYYELFRFLMGKECLFPEDMVFVDDIAAWCRQHDVPETDHERPLKLILKDGRGCKMVIREDVSDAVIEERINAMRIRGQVLNVATDRADMLDTVQKKLAYLFLSEYATSLPDAVGDLLADDWAFEEMKRLGYFQNIKSGSSSS